MKEGERACDTDAREDAPFGLRLDEPCGPYPLGPDMEVDLGMGGLLGAPAVACWPFLIELEPD